MRIFLLPTFFLLCGLLTLSGCGKKGDLYLPDNTKPNATPAASTPQPTQPAQK